MKDYILYFIVTNDDKIYEKNIIVTAKNETQAQKMGLDVIENSRYFKSIETPETEKEFCIWKYESERI